MTMITPSYLGETIEYSSLHACRSTLEDPTLAIADELKASPYPFVMIVALAASTAFVTPVSSPVNTLVVTPGNYSFGDFVRIGAPFAVIVMVVSVLLVPWLLPL